MAWRSDDQNLCDKRIAPIVNVRWKLFFAVVMTTAFVFGAGSAFAASPRKYDCVKKRSAATHPELCATPKASPWTAWYCGMGHCSWTRIIDVNKVQVNERRILLHVREQTCHKDYPNGRSYPNSYACRPNETEVADEAVYCSTQSPRYGYHGNDNKWIVQHLSFDDQHDYHAIHWAIDYIF